MHVYFISGLGADERVFQFLDLPGVEKRFIKWVDPQKGESLKQYCKKLITQIDLSKEVILVGISFGGIVAQEIGAIVPCKKIIIISSVKSPKEFSWSLSLVRITHAHRLFPAWFLKWSNKLTADYYFGIHSKQESILLHQIIEDTDQMFMVWAIDQIMKWHGVSNPTPAIHIHGTGDRIFPIGPINNAIHIPHGGHFMIVNRSAEISAILLRKLNISIPIAPMPLP